jgi:hypothetical protein
MRKRQEQEKEKREGQEAFSNFRKDSLAWEEEEITKKALNKKKEDDITVFNLSQIV